METCGLTPALLKYFGKKSNQSNSDFLQEMKALTDEDRAYFKKLLEETGQFKIV